MHVVEHSEEEEEEKGCTPQLPSLLGLLLQPQSCSKGWMVGQSPEGRREGIGSSPSLSVSPSLSRWDFVETAELIVKYRNYFWVRGGRWQKQWWDFLARCSCAKETNFATRYLTIVHDL